MDIIYNWRLKKKKKLGKNKGGFTLIELIVVIAIIGVLSALIVPSMAGYVDQAKAKTGDASVRTVYTAAQAAAISVTPATITIAESGSTTTGYAGEINKLIGGAKALNGGAYTVGVSDGVVTSVTYTKDGNLYSYPE